ncbi:anti-sigma regulatory factor [Psychromonas aquimarina]|uniref:anti-sigma regulatory factor n=1 Tax=Psychromonas aquimarina TaxID=444919 RepID=UPI000428E929|nr:anti-sigma regulatory factor [Psychromonas aquimarina]
MIQQKLETINLDVKSETDVAHAALDAKNYAKELGFSKACQYMISTAVSELARNIFVYAETGTINLGAVEEGSKRGIEVVAQDAGPGIQDITKAMEEEFSTGGTMGIGLPGTQRLMDDFKIDSRVGLGTKVTVRKWI